MKRMFKEDMPEFMNVHKQEQTWNPKRKQVIDGFGIVTHKTARGSLKGIMHCAKCGNEVKVFVSPKRNPHSSKLGRAVSMKDHDLCRRCWRQLMHQQKKAGVVQLSLSFFKEESLRPRLLVPIAYSLPRQAS